VLAIAGGKGGCGKTTTALGLARALASGGRSPVVLDADVEMPDLHVLSDVPPAPGVPALAGGREPAGVAHAVPGFSGASVVPAAGGGPDDVAAAAANVREWDGPVLLDCPAGISRDAAVPLRVADRTLLVSTPTRESLRGAVKTATVAAELDAPPVGLVLVETTPADRSGTIATRVARDLFRCPVLDRVRYTPRENRSRESVFTKYKHLARKVQKRNI